MKQSRPYDTGHRRSTTRYSTTLEDLVPYSTTIPLATASQSSPDELPFLDRTSSSPASVESLRIDDE